MKLRETIGRGAALALGIAYGAGMMYLLDPDLGHRRRALLRQKMLKVRNQIRRRVDQRVRYALHDFQGKMAEVRSQVTEGHVPDDILQERVRAQLGHVVQNPSSLEIICDEGKVFIRGPVLEGERRRIERRLSHTRGVRDLGLDVHEQRDTTAGPAFASRAPRQQQKLG